METRWLQDFLTLAECGSFTRAAVVRHASQAAFSRRIQSLERWLGVMLFDRSAFPARLTAEGARFREQAGAILGAMLAARAGLAGPGAPEMVRVALPYALATGALPGWMKAWNADGSLSLRVESGNVHDMVAALVAGAVDLLICFHGAEQPIELDPARYERAVLRRDTLAPHAAPGVLDACPWPGSAGRPVPLLLYPASVYFGRLVALALDGGPAPVQGRMVMECDMADVLRNLVLAGAGVAWLPGCSVAPGMAAVGGGLWDVEVQTLAFRERGRGGPALERLWGRLAAGAEVVRGPVARQGVGMNEGAGTCV